MNRFLNHAFTGVAGFVLAPGSIGAIVAVPPAQAEPPAALALPVMA